MRNSKQQSYSVSIRSKRQQMRNQIRKEQLQQIFKTKRLQLFHARQHDQKFQIYRELHQKIQICQEDLQMVQFLSNQIKDLYRKNPTSIWNFYLIGNFLMKRSQKVFDFQDIILCEKNLQFCLINDFAWCFGICITLGCSLTSRSRNNINNILKMQKYDSFMSQLLERYCKNFQLSEQSIAIMEIYIPCFTVILTSSENETFFPVLTFNSLFSNIQKFYSKISFQNRVFVRKIKIQITDLVNNVVHQIKTKELYSNEVREFTNEQQKRFIINTASMQKFMKFAAEMFFQNLTDPSDDRNSCIQSIKILSECNPIAAGEFLFTKKNVKQFQYLMLNHKSTIREPLLRSFNSILPSIINSKLIEFLDQSLHINLTYLLKLAIEELPHKDSSFDKKTSNFLFYTLSVIQCLLQKVQYLDSQMFQNVLYKMNMNGFDELVDRMGGERYDQKIEEIWSSIVDCYFSDDVSEGNNQSNVQNNGDFINQSHYTTNHNQYQVNKQNNRINNLGDNGKRISQENEQCII